MGCNCMPLRESNSAPLDSIRTDLNAKNRTGHTPLSRGISGSFDKARNP